MSLAVVGFAFLAFLFLFFIQILISRLFRPTSEDKFIFSLFVLLPLPMFGIAWAYSFFGALTLVEGSLTYLLFFVLSSSWVASYPAIYADCPSLIVAYMIYRSPHGISFQEMRQLLVLKANSQARIRDAVHNKWITHNGNRIELTAVGRLFLWLFRTYRTLLGLKLDPL